MSEITYENFTSLPSMFVKLCPQSRQNHLLEISSTISKDKPKTHLSPPYWNMTYLPSGKQGLMTEKYDFDLNHLANGKQHDKDHLFQPASKIK